MKKKAVLKNGFIGISSQILKILFTFLARSLFIKYLGKELLGLNSTFASIISTLAVTELGFQTAVAFSLYKPIHDKNYDEINDIINILKVVYRFIGIFFLVASILLLPFLRFLITGIEVNRNVWIYFLLQSFASSCTYFLAYKRVILFADQKEYVSKAIDMIMNIVFSILQCLCLVFLKDYVVYLVLRICQVFISNLFIHIYCSKYYSYLYSTGFNKSLFSSIFGKVKKIFAARIAGYIYSSTDNIIVSTFVSTVSVGMLVNYTTITMSLKTITSSLLNSMTPIIGGFLVEVKDSKRRKKAFDLYAHIMYLIALATAVPLLILTDEFITWWVGKDMLMSRAIIVLISTDYYIHLVHGCLQEFIVGGGYFEEDRNIEVIGAITNITTSLFLVRYLGISGVLIGTVISQMVFWFGRSYIVFFKCLAQDKKSYCLYWIQNFSNALLFFVIYLICSLTYSKLVIKSILLKMLFGGIIIETMVLALSFILFFKKPEQKDIISIMTKMIRKKVRL